MSYDNSSNWNVSTFWYPAKRFIKYGDYRSTTWGSLYGSSVQDKVNVSVPDFDKDCLIFGNSTDQVFPEDCDAQHQHNCTISEADQHQFCSSDCTYCFSGLTCVANVSTYSPATTWRRWVEYRRHPFNPCTGCFRRVNHCPGNANMVLSFNGRLFLTIYSPSCLYNKGDPDYIYCFTDAGDELIKRVNIMLVRKDEGYPYLSTRNYLVYQVELEDYIGQYWCETVGHLEGNTEYKSNTIMAAKITTSNEFAVRLRISSICSYMTCPPTNELDLLLNDIKQPIESQNFAKVRLMKITAFHQNADITIHASTLHWKYQLVEDFNHLKNILLDLPDYIKVVSVRSSERCLPEVEGNLTWPITRSFQRALSNEFCLQENGAPVSRYCSGDFISGLQWGKIKGTCSLESSNYNTETLLLQTYLSKGVSAGVMEGVSEIVEYHNLSLVDLYIVSRILEKSSEVPVTTMLDATFNVVNGLLQKDIDLLFSAQSEFNLTDSYLRNCELLVLNTTSRINQTSVTLKKDNVIFHSFNPLKDDTSGFVLYKNYTIKNLPSVLTEGFDSVEDIHEVKLAVCISPEDIAAITENQLLNVSAVFVIYLNGNFFPANTTSEVDLVVNANLLNYDDYLQGPIEILVNSGSNLNSTCAFWDYGNPQDPKKGDWSSSGSSFEGTIENNPNLQRCSYSHITHLALLVVRDQSEEFLEGVNDTILSLMTAIGSMLSLFGINGIFLTSCMFKFWRDKTGTQILLHLSFATLLEIVFMYLNGIKLFDCVVSGCILQYVIISKFAWMLIYAFCQYLRFVQVFKLMPNRFLAKSICFGWGFGIIPALWVALSNPTTYYKQTFCYPDGIYLYIGLYLPVAVVVVINCGVFCKIMREVTKGNLDKFHSTTVRIQQIKLAVLLFSVLGIPWIFGIVSNVAPWRWLKLVCVYIFTITAILQGFLMFLFYVIFNKETRSSWQRVLFYDKENYKIFSTSKSQSISGSVS